MDRKLLVGGVALLILAAVPMTSGYHIDGSTTTIADPNDAPGVFLSTSDWIVQNTGNLIVCESEGPMDDLNENIGGSLPGQGGLCYTGRNDATGDSAPGATEILAAGAEGVCAPHPLCVPPPIPVPPNPPAANNWTEIDTCSDTIWTRNGGSHGPFLYAPLGLVPYSDHAASLAAACAAPGAMDDHFWFGRVGTVGCDVEPTQSLHYSERFAWWTYELGTPQYSSGDSAGAAHLGTAANFNGWDGRRDAYHGHVDMFIDGVFLLATGAPSTGSAVTTEEESPFPGGLYLDCGASSAPPVAGGTGAGPLFREGPEFNPLALPLCADMESPLTGRLTFACPAFYCDDPIAAEIFIGHFSAPVAGQAVVGDWLCDGVEVATSTCTDDVVGNDLLIPPASNAECATQVFFPPADPPTQCLRDFADPADTYTGNAWYVHCFDP